MPALGSVRWIFANASRLLRPSQKLDCSECDRWERCGLAPSEQCIARAAQLAERNEGTPLPHAGRSRWLGSLRPG